MADNWLSIEVTADADMISYTDHCISPGALRSSYSSNRDKYGQNMNRRDRAIIADLFVAAASIWQGFCDIMELRFARSRRDE